MGQNPLRIIGGRGRGRPVVWCFQIGRPRRAWASACPVTPSKARVMIIVLGKSTKTLRKQILCADVCCGLKIKRSKQGRGWLITRLLVGKGRLGFTDQIPSKLKSCQVRTWQLFSFPTPCLLKQGSLATFAKAPCFRIFLNTPPRDSPTDAKSPSGFRSSRVRDFCLLPTCPI